MEKCFKEDRQNHTGPGAPDDVFYIDHLWYNYMSTYTQKEGTIKEFRTMILKFNTVVVSERSFHQIQTNQKSTMSSKKAQWGKQRLTWLLYSGQHLTLNDLESEIKKTTKIKFCRQFDWSTAIEQSEIMDHYTLSIKCMG